MKIRKADPNKDYEGIWQIFQHVVTSGNAYAFDPKTPKSDLANYWFAETIEAFVAVENSKVIGTYFMRPNQPSLGNHIANAGYMVHPNYRGQGIGHALAEHSIQWAQQTGYRGIQFNFVVSTNTVAVQLWKKFGFEIIGTVPQGFRHLTQGFVDIYIMYKSLI